MSILDGIILFAAFVGLISSMRIIIQKQMLGNAGLFKQRVILEGFPAVFYGVGTICIAGLLVMNVCFVPNKHQLIGNLFSILNVVALYLFIYIVSMIMQMIIKH